MNENYADFYKRKKTLEIKLLSSFFIIFPVIFVSGYFLHVGAPLILGIIWVGCFIYFSCRLFFIKCPKCKKYYYMTSWGLGNPYTSKCMNCGLQKEQTDKERKIEKVVSVLVLIFLLLAFAFLYFTGAFK